MSNDRQFPEWDQLYRDLPGERMPWYYADLDPDLGRALEAFALRGGRALDLGTGPGTQAIALARLGFEVTGTDLAAAAIESARARSAAEGVTVQFRQDDVLDSTIEGPFDLVFDRGCFHVFPPERRALYVDTVRRLVAPGGYLFLKCFSTKQPGEIGPYKFDAAEIERLFGGSFTVLSVEDTVYHGTLDPLPRALFCTLQRLGR